VAENLTIFVPSYLLDNRLEIKKNHQRVLKVNDLFCWFRNVQYRSLPVPSGSYVATRIHTSVIITRPKQLNPLQTNNSLIPNKRHLSQIE